MNEKELEGEDLDRAVAHALGRETTARTTGLHARFLELAPDAWSFWSPSTMWMQGGPIIEREKIAVWYSGDGWNAGLDLDCATGGDAAWLSAQHWSTGPTPLIAAMRAFVASKKSTSGA